MDSNTMNNLTPQDLYLGEYVMRRRFGEKEPQWVLTRINETYYNLIKKFPQDYRVPTQEELKQK